MRGTDGGSTTSDLYNNSALPTEPIHEPNNASSQNNNHNHHHHHHRATKSQTSFHPLTLGTADSPLADKSRLRARFVGLLTTALTSRPPAQEAHTFLERFRYAIVSSRLLDRPGGDPRRAGGSSDPSLPLGLTHTDSGPASLSPHFSAKAHARCSSCLSAAQVRAERRFWTRSSASASCAIVVLAMLAWALSSRHSILVTPSTPEPSPLALSASENPLALLLHSLRYLPTQPIESNDVKTTHRAVRSLALVAVTFGASLFVHAYARRRAHRILRLRLVTAAESLAQAFTALDATASKSLAVLREIDLLARGYRPDLGDASATLGRSTPVVHNVAAYVSQLRQQQQQKQSNNHDDAFMGRHLRAALASGLCLLTSQLARTVRGVLPHCSKIDLDKYLDIYELDVRVLLDFGWNTIPCDVDESLTGTALLQLLDARGPVPEETTSFGAHASLARLRLELYKVQFLRSVYACCLLSVPVQSFGNELEKWRAVLAGAQETVGLAQQLVRPMTVNQLATGVEPSIAVPEEIPAPPPSLQQPSEQFAEAGVWRRRQRTLNTIFGSLQHIEARMEMLRDTATVTAGAEDLQPGFETNFALVGSEIENLLENWARARKEFIAAGALRNTHEERRNSDSMRGGLAPRFEATPKIQDSPAASVGSGRVLRRGSLPARKPLSTTATPPTLPPVSSSILTRPPTSSPYSVSSSPPVSRTGIPVGGPSPGLTAQQFRIQQQHVYGRIMEEVRARGVLHHRRDISELSGVSGVSGVSNLTLVSNGGSSSGVGIRSGISGVSTAVASPDEETVGAKYGIQVYGGLDNEDEDDVSDGNDDASCIDYSRPSADVTRNLVLELGSVLDFRRSQMNV